MVKECHDGFGIMRRYSGIRLYIVDGAMILIFHDRLTIDDYFATHRDGISGIKF